MNTPTFADWKANQLRIAEEKGWASTSFDVYRREFPEVKEYQVFVLDPNTKMSHLEGAPLLETDHSHEAHSFIYDAYKNEGLELCIYQQRNNGYCGYYRRPDYHNVRAKDGKFKKAA